MKNKLTSTLVLLLSLGCGMIYSTARACFNTLSNGTAFTPSGCYIQGSGPEYVETSWSPGAPSGCADSLQLNVCNVTTPNLYEIQTTWDSTNCLSMPVGQPVITQDGTTTEGFLSPC